MLTRALFYSTVVSSIDSALVTVCGLVRTALLAVTDSKQTLGRDLVILQL